MAGSVVVLDSTGATVTSTVQIGGGRGSHYSATYYYDCSAVTGTWTVTANWVPGGTAIPIAATTAAQVTAAGLYLLALASPFTLTNRAVPSPDTVTYTEDTAGTLAGRLIAIYGD